VVAETDLTTPLSSSRTLATTVVLPHPDGADMMKYCRAFYGYSIFFTCSRIFSILTFYFYDT
jgi:hypothetical protein